jgi:hypothetical protein
MGWTAFNMPAVIQQNARQVAITYGPDRARFMRADLNETGTSTSKMPRNSSCGGLQFPCGAVHICAPATRAIP